MSNLERGRSVAYYRRHTSLTLGNADIDALRDAHIESFEAELKGLYPDFETFPEEAQVGLFDMIFNLGQPKLKKQFPLFNRAVNARNWTEAAKQSKRGGIGAKRNEDVRRMFEDAARSEEVKDDANARPKE